MKTDKTKTITTININSEILEAAKLIAKSQRRGLSGQLELWMEEKIKESKTEA